MSSQQLQLTDSERQSSCIKVLALRFDCSFEEAAAIWVTEGHAEAYRAAFPFH